MFFPRRILLASWIASIGASSVSVSSSDSIVLSASITVDWSWWTSGSVTLSQCNSQCAAVNLGLFTTCGAYDSIFSSQMQCCCSTTFSQQVEVCSACCNELGYTAYYKQLTQVASACDTLETQGNTPEVAKSLTYVPVTYTATIPGNTVTATVVLVSTKEVSHVTATDEDKDKTTSTIMTSTDIATPTSTTTKTAASSTHAPTTTTTTTVVVSKDIPATSAASTSAKTSAAALPIVTAITSNAARLPTFASISQFGFGTLSFFVGIVSVLFLLL